MAWKTSDTAAAIAENSGIAAEQIELALRVIGFQSHTPDLQTVLRRAADLVGRFEALRVPCPGLKEIIDCFILAGRLAEFASTELGSNELRTRYINASADEVFDLREKKRHDLEKDLIAICWIAKVVAHILPVPRSIELNTSELCSLLQMFVLEGKSGATLVEILSPFPFWERLQRLCDILSEEEERAHLRSEFRMLREVLSGLTTVHVPALKISKIQLRNAIQLPLTERALTSAC